jgi:hypothetical protein
MFMSYAKPKQNKKPVLFPITSELQALLSKRRSKADFLWKQGIICP